MVKQNISTLIDGFRLEPGSEKGFDIYTVLGWDYPALVKTYQEAAESVRQNHIPAIIHVHELTQPQGHSTSGSHERYKSEERLTWEAEFDCLVKFREWIIESNFTTAHDLDLIEDEERHQVEKTRKEAWEDYMSPILVERANVAKIIAELEERSSHSEQLEKIRKKLLGLPTPFRRDSMSAARQALAILRNETIASKDKLIEWKKLQDSSNEERYSSHLYSQSSQSALRIEGIKSIYSSESPII